MRHIVRLGLVMLAALAFSGANGQQLTTNFDDITTLPGAGWVFTNNSVATGSVAWFQGNSAVFSAQTGAASSYLAGNFNAAAFGGNISLWALTPTLSNLQNGEVLTFYTRTETGAPAADRLEVRLSTNGASSNVGAIDTSVGDFTTLLLAINPTLTLAGYPNTWTQFTVTLSGLPAGPTTGRIGFRYFVTNTATNGDYIGIDTLNLTDPPADLTITKTHVGNFAQGQVGATYTITATNSGATPTAGTVTVSDTVPAGLTPTSAAGSGWSCPIAAQVVTCTRSDVLAPAASYPPITLTVNVAGNAPASVTNTATVAGGGETNVGNDTASDPTTISPTVPDLTITKTHAGNFAQGQVGATYTITATNSGAAPTAGTVTVSDTVPAGLTPTSAAGSGWSCPIAAQVVTCTRSDVLAPAASYPPITLTVNVAGNAPASVTNTATVAGGGETNVGNDTASDPTTISPTVPDLTITKTHVGNFAQGQVGATYTITATNSGAAPTAGTVTVSDTVPAGLTPTSAAGSGWSCPIAAQVVTCTRSDVLAPAASYPPITLTVNVAGNAPASVTNTATVAGGGETNVGNDTASDPTTISPTVPDLTITKTHAGNFAQGQVGATYTITATNSGAAPTAGTVTVSDTVPAGLTPTSAAGSGWSCPIAAQVVTCTRSDVLAPAASYPPITLTVNVAGNAPASVTNTATVAGGGETNVGNDTAGDPTTVVPVPPTPVPTQGESTLMLISALLALLGTSALKRRARGRVIRRHLPR